ncbi:unnamed protein product [Brachionus calyciflorus]|uniref:Uncharacterized protein n=1 Tax=Brachionus calyciflorus TaxID=104777 RepID=A0A813ZSN1_9BILA|nr:unnamed protein product [Brachionus calyciflorus]
MSQNNRSKCISKSLSQPQIQSKKSTIEIIPRQKSPEINHSNSDVSVLSSSSDIELKHDKNRNQKKTQKNPFTDHLKNLGQNSVYSKNDFFIIQWTCDNNFSVLKLTEVGEPKIIKIDKEYPVKYDKKILRATVKFVGSRSEFESKLESFTSYENLLTNSEPDNTKFENNENKIRELEEIVNKKNKELSTPKSELERKNNIILCYKNTYNEANVKKILDFSLNFIYKYLLSSNYESVVLTREQKIELDKYVKSDDSDTSVFRKLIGTLIVEDEAWALRDRDFIKTDFKSEFFAAFDYISHKRPQFPMSVADNETRKMCNEIRKRSRDAGYKIEVNDDKSPGQLRYKIISKSQIQHRTLKRKGVFSEEVASENKINDKESARSINENFIENIYVDENSDADEDNEIKFGKKCRRNRVFIEESDSEKID